MADTTFAAELAAAAAANAVVDAVARSAAADAKANPTLTSAAIVAVGGDTTARASAAAAGVAAVAASVAATTAAVDPVARRDKFLRWAASYRGMAQPRNFMLSPPTITVGTTTSTINGNTGGNVTIARADSRLSYAGTVPAAFGGSSSFYGPGHISVANPTLMNGGAGNGSSGSGGVWRPCFASDAPAIEFVRRMQYNSSFNIAIDGDLVFSDDTQQPSTAGATGDINFKIDFGADATAFFGLGIASVSAGGSGHAVGDVITLAGASPTTPIQIRVGGVSSGAVTGGSIIVRGSYPANPGATVLTQASTTGSGTGATFTINWSRSHTTRKMRRYELWLPNNAGFRGLNIGALDTVVPYDPTLGSPRILWIGDSITATSFAQYRGGMYARQVSEYLGIPDWWISAYSGTGYINVGASLENFPTRVLDIGAANPDMLVIAGGINDGTAGSSVLQAAAAAYYADIQTRYPKLRTVVLSPWRSSNGTPAVGYNTALAAAVASAPDQSRIRFVDLYAAHLQDVDSAVGSGNIGQYVGYDGTHPGQAGHDFIGRSVAPLIGAAFIDMATVA